MKVSLNWLRELVELPPSVSELVELLTLAGVEVEGVQTLGVAIPNVVVAQIRESVQHPNADRLSVCQIDDGSGAARQIVCGAKNYKVGDKVPVALPGAVLPGDFKIKVGKLRGVESQGMLCSADELGLPKGEDGLLILSPDAKPGTPFCDLFPGDTILDVEITPNRPDLLSVNGMAREIGALIGKPVKLAGLVGSPAIPDGSSLTVEAVECALYTVRKIAGVQVGPSPAWLRSKLEAVGLRPINNIVDATNYVMLELGQPLHAFDAAKLDGDLIVRLAREGETLSALDGKTYKLSATQLVIADASKVTAIAGVMGGHETGVTNATADIWLESACFQPQSIRRTSRALGVSSDSSYRFERGVDRAAVLAVSQRAVELIIEIAGGIAEPIRAGIEPHSTLAAATRLPDAVVPLRASRVALLLGAVVPIWRVDQILTGFGLSKTSDGWRIPSFRADLRREVDLIEEIARVVGMDAIPARTEARFAPASDVDRAYDAAMNLRRVLVSQGIHEARSLTLVPAQPLGLACTQVSPESLRRVKNPMIEDQVVLRPNLMHGLLSAVAGNIQAGARSVRLFEVGRVYANQTPEENCHAALVLSGPLTGANWRSTEGNVADLFDLKGIVREILGAETAFQPSENSGLALSLTITLGGRVVGVAGQLWPADARALNTTEPVLFAELDLTALAQAAALVATGKYREIPRFPTITRDIALLAPIELPHARVAYLLTEAREPLLTDVTLFDVFTDSAGVKVPADKKSLAY